MVNCLAVKVVVKQCQFLVLVCYIDHILQVIWRDQTVDNPKVVGSNLVQLLLLLNAITAQLIDHYCQSKHVDAVGLHKIR